LEKKGVYSKKKGRSSAYWGLSQNRGKKAEPLAKSELLPSLRNEKKRMKHPVGLLDGKGGREKKLF